MKKELIDRIKTAISNAKHVCSHQDYGFRGHIEATPLEVYLVDKIEGLEKEISDIKVRHEIDMTVKHKRIK